MHTIDKSKATAARSTKHGSGERKKGDEGGSSKSSKASTEDDTGEFSTLYIKNLNFETSENDLKKHLTGRLGINESSIRTVSIPKKQKNGHILSMGFGFVEFRSTSGAADMMGRINASVLDGHSLEAKPSDKRISVATKGSAAGANDPNATNKLVVRNVAFQATREELMALFAVFGAVKRIRIPRKVGGVHRGFAFVDFSSKQEAAAAMSALSSTHLYGRHLVIEWAKDEDDDMGKLRDQAKQHAKAITSAAAAAGRKRKVADVLGGADGGGGDEDVSMLYEE
jgi:multiple RNA-binding domain-containing protein 1